jgi:NADPH:quinone reductase-like Zn-dependent oxidoreductase
MSPIDERLKSLDRPSGSDAGTPQFMEPMVCIRLIEADRLVKLPKAISFEQAATMMLQGMTAQVLMRQVYPVKAGDLIASANELFEVVASGKVRISVNQRFALKDAADAHKALEARATSGSTILII